MAVAAPQCLFTIRHSSTTKFDGSFRSDYPFLSLCAAGIALLSAVAWRARPKNSAVSAARTKSLAACAGVVLTLTTRLAWPLYAAFGALQYLQFPWRWLPFAAFMAMVAFAMAIQKMARPNQRWAFAAMTIWTGVMYAVFTFGWAGWVVELPRTTVADEAWAISSMPRDAPEYRPAALREMPRSYHRPPPAAPALADSEEIVLNADRQELRTWLIDAREPGRILFGTACFPGWRVNVGGLHQWPACRGGQLEVLVPAGHYPVSLHFETTSVRYVGRLISGAAGLLLLMWMVRIARDGFKPVPGAFLPQ